MGGHCLRMVEMKYYTPPTDRCEESMCVFQTPSKSPILNVSCLQFLKSHLKFHTCYILVPPLEDNIDIDIDIVHFYFHAVESLGE
jgi:hypothetical protein